ncbi:MAG: type II secretion system protein GspL [Allosphingosinicella sp.]|uniref:type II secretion system protein GspL n=1 Tax=Allosphingosinicella sp. TaxID=2823234 RepID=UPI003962F673
MSVLLLFAGRAGGIEGWYLAEESGVTGRGTGAEPPPRADRTVLVVPGEDVALHWLELPSGLTRPQAAAAARLMAGELSAEPIGEMHVAVGREPEEGARRCTALVPNARMAAWVALAPEADAVVPETLLLPAPETGFVRYDGGPVPVFRGPDEAFAMEPELAAHLVGAAEVRTLEQKDFEAGLAAAALRPDLDLRQGAFARKRQWGLDWPRMRRAALLALALVGVTLAIQIVTILRYTYDADRLEAEARTIAGGEDLGNRMDALGGGGGYGAAASALFAAVRQTGNLELGAMTYDAGVLRATLLADQPATIAAAGERVEAQGLAADIGPLRTVEGRSSAEILVRTR